MQLGRRCANRLGVLARTSSMLYKNVVRGASDIGEALRADYLVEGSVRREGDRVRITAQLIETKGETHLWADSYDRTMADCLAVQTEVATEIATALAHGTAADAARKVDGHAPLRVPIRRFCAPGSTGTSRPTPGSRTPSPDTTNRSRSIRHSARPTRGARARGWRFAITTGWNRRARSRRHERCPPRPRDRSGRCRGASRDRRSRAHARLELVRRRSRVSRGARRQSEQRSGASLLRGVSGRARPRRKRWRSAIAPARSIRSVSWSRQPPRPCTICAATTSLRSDGSVTSSRWSRDT